MNNVSHMAYSIINAMKMLDADKQIKKESSDINLSSLDSKLSDLEEKILIVVFLTVIIFGFFGNGLVIWTVLLNKNMRTSNNLFILNLAISDLTLCIFSIPFNVYKTLKHTWVRIFLYITILTHYSAQKTLRDYFIY